MSPPKKKIKAIIQKPKKWIHKKGENPQCSITDAPLPDTDDSSSSTVNVAILWHICSAYYAACDGDDDDDDYDNVQVQL